MKRNVFLIVGRSGVGKDTVVNELTKLGYKQLISYTTRPRRDNEGETHIFINQDEVKDFKNDMCAYTQIGEYEYFATFTQLRENDIYIIDPTGVQNLLNNQKFINPDKLQDINFVIIYLFVPEDIRYDRLLNKRKDNVEVVERRLSAEREQFDKFEDEQSYDYIIPNIDLNVSTTLVSNIIKKYTTNS